MGSGRAASQRREMIITTTRAVYHIQRLGRPLIQMQARLGPWNDKKWTCVPHVYYLPKTKLEDMAYANIGESDGSITLSEKEYVDQEIHLYVFNCICEMRDRQTNVAVDRQSDSHHRKFRE